MISFNFYFTLTSKWNMQKTCLKIFGEEKKKEKKNKKALKEKLKCLRNKKIIKNSESEKEGRKTQKWKLRGNLNSNSRELSHVNRTALLCKCF